MTSRALVGSLLLALACRSESLRPKEMDAGAGGDLQTSGGRANAGGQANTGLTSSALIVDTVTNDGLPSCGPGCRLALNRPVNHGGLIPHAFSNEAVADTNQEELFFAAIGSSTTSVASETAALAYLEGSLLSYVSVPSWPAGDIMVLDIGSKRRTSYFRFDDFEAYGSPSETMLSEKYLFWMRGSATSRANLQTGEVTQNFSPAMQCDSGCVIGGKLICLDGERIITVDQETGARAYLDDGGALQFEGTCSVDRKRFAWVDFRDPPGPVSSYFGAHVGGEIYLYELGAGAIRRLTHDSPDAPITKSGVGIGSDLAVWFEPCLDCKKNFELDDSQGFWGSPVALVRLDLSTNRRCRYDQRPMGGHLSMHGHHVYGYWTDTVKQYLVDIDLDDPTIPWVCE